MDGCGNRHWQSDEGGRITSFVGKVGTYTCLVLVDEGSQTGRRADRQTGRQADRQAGRQADRRDRQGGGVEAM